MGCHPLYAPNYISIFYGHSNKTSAPAKAHVSLYISQANFEMWELNFLEGAANEKKSLKIYWKLHSSHNYLVIYVQYKFYCAWCQEDHLFGT